MDGDERDALAPPSIASLATMRHYDDSTASASPGASFFLYVATTDLPAVAPRTARLWTRTAYTGIVAIVPGPPNYTLSIQGHSYVGHACTGIVAIVPGPHGPVPSRGALGPSRVGVPWARPVSGCLGPVPSRGALGPSRQGSQ